MRSLSIPGPLLVNECSRVGKDSVVKLRVIPGHDESAGAARTVSHGRTGIGIFRELNVSASFYNRQDFFLDEFSVNTGHSVVLQTAFAALRISASVGDRDGDHRRNFALRDQSVESRKKEQVRSIGTHDERRKAAGYVLFGDVHGNLPCVGRGVAGAHDQFGGIGAIWGSEGVWVACDARTDFAW